MKYSLDHNGMPVMKEKKDPIFGFEKTSKRVCAACEAVDETGRKFKPYFPAEGQTPTIQGTHVALCGWCAIKRLQ